MTSLGGVKYPENLSPRTLRFEPNLRLCRKDALALSTVLTSTGTPTAETRENKSKRLEKDQVISNIVREFFMSTSGRGKQKGNVIRLLIWGLPAQMALYGEEFTVHLLDAKMILKLLWGEQKSKCND